MFIEVRGVNFFNKGAELMLRAIVQQYSAYDSNAKFAIGFRIGTYRQRTTLGLYHLARTNSLNFKLADLIINILLKLLPKQIRRALHIVLADEIDVILDASGLAYSDQIYRADDYAQLTSRLSNEWRKKGKTFILMPQAFGPLQNKKLRVALSNIVKNADLVYPRDRISYTCLQDLVNDSTKIKVSPDFTNLISGEILPEFELSSNQVCIIPNYRMLDRTDAAVKAIYPLFLTKCINHLIDAGLKPFILIHESKKDIELYLQIKNDLKASIPVIQESNALYIKGMIGSCYAVISSRFHGLVNSLSQKVPSIATGWNHKYLALLEDYDCQECLIEVTDSSALILEKLNLVINAESRSLIIQKLNKACHVQLQQTNQMWQEIHQTIRSKSKNDF
ncbi:polysaccharide pyruvyl transferase family protein [Almyronema epifaneia]|uniref:Polysaccharide pyruvyl transferase family protein n=1 Tax=Almyronema epifaneia S1 TaxID=2991925 RepID=A0ABW6IIS4_9CYAN